jgi:GH25 family lysozyme M1 (1,4-beta-N-acetylmuramidase)
MVLTRRFVTPLLLALLLVTVIPAGAGLASASSSAWSANCAVNVRTRPTTLATRKTVISTNTVVTASQKITGGSYGTSCKQRIYGSSWLAITAINGHSVKSLFGVTTLYAAAGLFRSVTSGFVATGPLYGIDVSRWQGWIDFAKVRASGKRFVIAKATEGRLYTDDAYSRNRAGAIAAGLAFTAYHYAHPDATAGDATNEANHFLAVAGLRRGMLIPALDLENGGALGTSGLQGWVKTWLKRVDAVLGVKPMIYTTPGFWQRYMGDTTWFAANGYRVVWVAHWNAQSPATPASNWGGQAWTFWQYSSCGTVSGISGCVDLDKFGGKDLADFRF